MEVLKHYEIKKYKNEEIFHLEDKVITERYVNLYVNGEPYISMVATPEYLKDLAIATLFLEGVIKSYSDIDYIEEKSGAIVVIFLKDKNFVIKEKKRILTSGCGNNRAALGTLSLNSLEKVESPYKIHPEKIIKTIKSFNKMSYLFLETGGVHSALFVSEKEEIIREDIGRHNAIDKVIGSILKDKIKVDNSVIYTTGRISSEILLKASKIKIPILVSHSAPTDMAIDLARELNITLIGFARGNRMNIYSCVERIIT